MNRFLRQRLDMLHQFGHSRGWFSDWERPLAADSGSFENYIDFFYRSCHHETKWMGKIAMKFPMDAWVFQEIIYDTRPDVIVEIGNANGGSTLFLAQLMDLMGKGRVVAVDIDHSKIDFKHPRISWITGDASSPEIVSRVRDSLKSDERVMVIEDSSHTYENTLSVIENYHSMVSVGCYLVVEDGVCRYPFVDGPKPGPYEAIHAFLEKNDRFTIDRSRERFKLTFNPDGYLLKVK